MQTAENLAAFTKVQVTMKNVFSATPRYQGNMNEPMRIQTSVSGQIVDEISQLYPKMDKVSNMTSCDIDLASKVNLEKSALKL